MKKAFSYQEDLIEQLKDIDFSIAYLNQCVKDKDPRIFLNAVREVLEAHNGLKLAAEKVDSNNINPEIYSLYKLMRGLGLRFALSKTDEHL